MSDVRVLRAHYRITTPMFLAGANQKEAELRVPSIKGALRFWWRATAGACYPTLGEMRETEDKIFGSVRTGISRVRIRIENAEVVTRPFEVRARNPWEQYTGYGRVNEGKDSALMSGSTFTVHLRCSSLEDEEVNTVMNALIALGLVGGLGGRSRKGWGSLTLSEIYDGEVDKWKAPSSGDGLLEELQQRFSPDGKRDPRGWSAVSSRSQVVVGPERSSPGDAQSWLASRYMDHIKNDVDKGKREGFGLPRLWRNNEKVPGRNWNKRRAAAVFLHVHSLGQGPAWPVALALPATFLPSQAEPAGGWDPVLNFLARVSNE